MIGLVLMRRTNEAPIRAVLFDAGQTLLYPDPPVEAVYVREFMRDGVSPGAEGFGEALQRTWAEVMASSGPNRYGGIRGEPEFWRAFLNRVRSCLDGGMVSDEAFGRLARHFRDAAAWKVYDDVRPTLEALRNANVSMAVVSNWDSYLPALLDGLGLTPYFARIFVSAIEETGKPHPEIFRRACAAVGVKPGEALHVGDSPSDDYEGARNAGLNALLLDREGRYGDLPERIRTLREIPERVVRPPTGRNVNSRG
jgi:putative hydrolase of the HAD superfamily